MRPARRRVVLLATLRELEATLTDAAIDMFIALVGRAHLRARKRLEQRVAVSGREGRERMLRIARVLEAISQAARAGGGLREGGSGVRIGLILKPCAQPGFPHGMAGEPRQFLRSAMPA